MQRTARGFEFIEFKDIYDAQCSLQQSSLAGGPVGGTAIWLGTDAPGKPEAKRMHLDRKQVKALIRHLERWLEHGTFK